MLTLLQATAILSILIAFGVDNSTVDNIRAILIVTPVVKAVTKIESQGASHYKFYNRTGGSIQYKTATIKVYRIQIKEPLPKDVSIELYYGENLVSKAGYWSQEGHLVEGEVPFTLNATMGTTEANALVIELPINLTVNKNTEHTFRTEIHADNQNINSGNSYQANLISLNE